MTDLFADEHRRAIARRLDEIAAHHKACENQNCKRARRLIEALIVELRR
jgi:hypothetical protein